MGKTTKAPAGTLVLALCLLCACAQADPPRARFEIAVQPLPSSLNEFARQADVTLIFSYDAVSGARGQALQGRYAVDDGLDRLLRGTPLSYRKASDGSYLVCLPADCSASTREASVHAHPDRPAEQ